MLAGKESPSWKWTAYHNHHKQQHIPSEQGHQTMEQILNRFILIKCSVNKFKANLLYLNINKTYLLQFCTNNTFENTLELNYINKTIVNVQSVKFLGLLVDDTLSWDQHINQVASKLSSACCAIWTLTPLLSKNALRMLYFSYAHSIISYGIIFWGNSGNSIKIFRQQKKILRILSKKKNRVMQKTV